MAMMAIKIIFLSRFISPIIEGGYTSTRYRFVLRNIVALSISLFLAAKKSAVERIVVPSIRLPYLSHRRRHSSWFMIISKVDGYCQ